MIEIYWLQRLGNIGFCFNVGFWVCIAIACELPLPKVRGFLFQRQGLLQGFP